MEYEIHISLPTESTFEESDKELLEFDLRHAIEKVLHEWVYKKGQITQDAHADIFQRAYVAGILP